MSLNIAIAGAGIGGLAAAVLCARDGHQVTLFEKFDQPRPVGSGLVIQPVGLAVLDQLGIGTAARDLSAPITRMVGRDRRGDRMALDISYPGDKPGRAFHRASLFDLLWRVAQAEGIRVITSARITDAPLTLGKRHLLLQNGGSHGPFDLVIDASGAGSALSPMQARRLPFGALWASVPWPRASGLAQDMLHQRYEGAHRMAGILPTGRLPDSPDPVATVFWSLPAERIPDWPDIEIEDWRATVCDHWPDMRPFVQDLPKSALTPAIYSHGSLRRPYAAALAHIGDAAHRTSPQLGQGANMALLDAYALSLALRREPVEDALPAYAAMRRWHRRGYQAMSRLLTPMYQSHSRALPWLRNALLAPSSRFPGIRSVLTHVVAGTVIPPLAGVAMPSEPPRLMTGDENAAATL